MPSTSSLKLARYRLMSARESVGGDSGWLMRGLQNNPSPRDAPQRGRMGAGGGAPAARGAWGAEAGPRPRPPPPASGIASVRETSTNTKSHRREDDDPPP